jgi:hypothetical protein
MSIGDWEPDEKEVNIIFIYGEGLGNKRQQMGMNVNEPAPAVEVTNVYGCISKGGNLKIENRKNIHVRIGLGKDFIWRIFSNISNCLTAAAVAVFLFLVRLYRVEGTLHLSSLTTVLFFECSLNAWF